jgi:hypothetical protein
VLPPSLTNTFTIIPTLLRAHTHTCLGFFSRLRCTRAHLSHTVNSSHTHPCLPPSLTLCIPCCVIQKPLAWAKGVTGQRVGGMEGTLHPPTILHSHIISHISFPALSFCYESSPWNAALNDWFILCQTILGSDEIIEAVRNGRLAANPHGWLDEVSRWLAANPHALSLDAYPDAVCSNVTRTHF